MKKNLNIFISILNISLIFASLEAVHGMEALKPDKQDLKRAYLGTPNNSDITEEPLQKKRKSKDLQENLFERCPEEIKVSFFKYAVVDNYSRSAHIPSLKLVCQEWYAVINKDFVDSAILLAYELLGYGEIYKKFLKSKLIYRPQEGSDVGMATLPIANLENPLEGEFDLSQCGDTGKYLSILTGYRKQKKAENVNKVEIWLVPRFLIAKELNTTAKHFQEIYENWEESAEVGIFWTWGGWDKLDNYDYLTMKNIDGLSIFNLYQNWQERKECGAFLFHKKVLRQIPQCAVFSFEHVSLP